MRILMIIIYFLLGSYVLAADTGATSPGTVVDDATVGTQTWTNPSNATASDDSSASVVIGLL